MLFPRQTASGSVLVLIAQCYSGRTELHYCTCVSDSVIPRRVTESRVWCGVVVYGYGEQWETGCWGWGGCATAAEIQITQKQTIGRGWGRRKHNDRQGVGFQGMLRAVVRPYRQNEMDSKIVTASQRRALWSLPLQHCLSVRERLSVSGN